MPADWLLPALRFGHYALLLGLCGAMAWQTPMLRHLAVGDGHRHRPLVVAAAIAVPVLSLGVMLAGIAAMMGQTLTDLDSETVWAMLSTTPTGWAFGVRMALLLAGLAAVTCAWNSPTGTIAAAAIYALVLLTLGWSGHAAASEGLAGLAHRVNNGVHLMAAALWIGAISGFAASTISVHRRPNQGSAQRLIAAMHDFRLLGTAIVATVASTGAINAQLIFGIENGIAVLAGPYGWLLAGKIALVALMLAFAAFHANRARERSAAGRAAAPHDTLLLPTLWASLTMELALATAVLGITAILGLGSPLN
jgi:putative copper resistance protein D